MDYQGSTTQIDLEGMLVNENIKPKALPFSLLKEITDSFSQYREIGTGGYAVVYKGILKTGMVAVKKLSNASLQETEFHREVESLMDVRHKNIVRFLGYCADTQGSMQLYNKKYVMADVRQRLLCFEYLPNRSLCDHMNDASCGLPWRKRYQIIKGICEGLNYLHMNRVFHLDLKPANILMDDNMEPKIADFGLSRCFDEGQSLIMATKLAGTIGYLPPESFDNPAITRQYDIYSLGVIITEILTGKRGYRAIEDVLDSWRNRLEESLEDTEFEQIRVCANIGKECTKRNPERRPRSVQHIIDRLKETENANMSSLEMAQEQTDGVASRESNTMYAEGLDGMDGPRDDLIKMMDGEDDELKVLCILGLGGLGKTTLANEIYDNLQGMFQFKAFVTVSHRPNIRKILKTMLSQVGYVCPKDTNMENLEELINVLRKYLLNIRYLIIIDDVWDATAWYTIRCAFPENINRSRVLVTTRITAVARACCGNSGFVYQMKQLCDQNSRRLFFKRIFGSEDGCPPYLKEVSAQILKICSGFPLAIITISSLIANQSSKLKTHWEYARDSLGPNLEMGSSLDGMRHILNLSYINLPHYLKTCMLYLCIYPEDYLINKNDLMWQWIAEGFICKVREVDLVEDIAKSCFNELITRGLIQPIDSDYNGEVTSCRIHDMILDLILHKSREENFVTVIDDIRDIKGHQHKIQRLSLLDGALDDKVPGYVQLSEIRTLAIFGTCSYLPPFQLFKHLQVLRIEITVGSNVPLLLDLTEIHHLIQLRYLKIIAEGHNVVMPSKMESMQQLETFEINAITRLSKGPSFEGLPLDLIHLSQLLHLILPDDVILPNGIGNMKSLRTLHCFNLHNSPNNIKGLGKLTNLTNLKILCDSRAMANDEIVEKAREVLHNCLGKLCNLKYLYMHFCSTSDACFDALSATPASFRHLQIFHGYKFSRVPEWIVKLHSLYDLSLTVKQVFEEDVQIFAQLPSVIKLELFILGIPEDNIIIHGSGFPVLKHFTFRCSRISCLAFVPRAMRNLEKLELDFDAKGWDRYGAAPTGTKHLSGLREFYVHIRCLGARKSNIRAAESALRNAIDMHPGQPVGDITCRAYSWWPHDDDDREEQEDDVSGGGPLGGQMQAGSSRQVNASSEKIAATVPCPTKADYPVQL